MLSKSENSNFIDMVTILTGLQLHLVLWTLGILLSKMPRSVKDIWPKVYETRMSLDFNRVTTTGKDLYYNDRPSILKRDGYDEEVYFSHTYSPNFKSDRTICALWCLAQENTQQVLNTRKLKLFGEFAHYFTYLLIIVDYNYKYIESLENTCHKIKKALRNNEDISYTLIYFVKHKLNISSEFLIAHLMATTFDSDDKEKRNIPDYLPEPHETIDLAIDANKSYDTYIELKRNAATYSFLKCDSWLIYLLFNEGRNVKILLKTNHRLRFHALDDRYMEFFNLVTNQVYALLQHGKSVKMKRIKLKYWLI
ncbi:PAS domain S-box protein [Gigaspora margarita]|uniref:PAS domain S-box protein n=1 Tax=Gigaspora margarita TaxID=4874 RepID=A0A8H4EUP1_GIGMA|nr:PAS domain S-box protein [Gigaspora margarita]